MVFLCFRIRTDERGGAWCPQPIIEHGLYEWLQVDLHNLTVITHVETQGRYGNGNVRYLVCIRVCVTIMT